MRFDLKWFNCKLKRIFDKSGTFLDIPYEQNLLFSYFPQVINNMNQSLVDNVINYHGVELVDALHEEQVNFYFSDISKFLQ